MDETLKKQAYLEGMRLKGAGHSRETIYARLEKKGIPEDLAQEVVMNLFLEQKKTYLKTQKTNYNVALVRIGLGVLGAIISAIILPGVIVLPIGLVVGGIIAAAIAENKARNA